MGFIIGLMYVRGGVGYVFWFVYLISDELFWVVGVVFCFKFLGKFFFLIVLGI